MPNNNSDDELEKNYANWIHRQKQSHNKEKLSEYQINKLEKIDGWIWSVKRGSINKIWIENLKISKYGSKSMVCQKKLQPGGRVRHALGRHHNVAERTGFRAGGLPRARAHRRVVGRPRRGGAVLFATGGGAVAQGRPHRAACRDAAYNLWFEWKENCIGICVCTLLPINIHLWALLPKG